jgi:hypothetical protein
MKRAVQGFVTLTLMGWLAVALAATVMLSGTVIWWQSGRIDSLKATIKATEVLAEAAKEAAEKQRVRDKQKQEKTDAEFKVVRGALFIANGKLRDYAGRSLLPAAPAGSGESNGLCFSRAQLDRTLQNFTSGTAELVAECEIYRATLENAQKWAGETR